jgi:sialic acid synthase SpsE/mannose-6-phosphate isomerase-like protein (cupin superfamily)
MEIKPLFILEMANNHMGDFAHGIRIIREMHSATKDFPVRIAVKFQYRQLDTFIHPDFKGRQDIKYIKRFNETCLTHEEFIGLKSEVQSLGMEAICTGFDEESIQLIEQQAFDAIKIASCSFTDWPLLERIAQTELPIIASVGGVTLNDIDRVVSFFENRNKNFSLMHCVAEYPTPDDLLNLNQIDFLRSRYPNVPVGFSTHERPDLLDAVKIAAAKGATSFERHVGVPTDRYNLNAYSSTPSQIAAWIEAALSALRMCGVAGVRSQATPLETRELHALRRGVFLRRAVKAGESITLNDVFFAIPTVEGQWTANDFSKYVQFQSTTDINSGEAALFVNTTRADKRDVVHDIMNQIGNFIRDSNVPLPSKAHIEISHHFGIENFYKTGAVILSFVNRSYCKKAIVMLPGQAHPEHSHKIKEETFFILHGSMTLTLNEEVIELKKGDSVLVVPGVSHSFQTETGVIFEEISSTHIVQDSFYNNPAITENKNRKTFVTYWIK